VGEEVQRAPVGLGKLAGQRQPDAMALPVVGPLEQARGDVGGDADALVGHLHDAGGGVAPDVEGDAPTPVFEGVAQQDVHDLPDGAGGGLDGHRTLGAHLDAALLPPEPGLPVTHVLADQADQVERPPFPGAARAGQAEQLVDGGVEPGRLGEGLVGLGPRPGVA
jgi:hypothetical protein